MPTDEQYGHQLGVQLRRETEEVRAAPDLLRRLRRRQVRRTWAIRTAIVTPVAVAAAAAMVMTTAGPSAPERGRQPTAAPPTDSVRLETVAQVRTQTLRALTRASQYVIYAKSTFRTGHYDTWIDKATRRNRNDVYSVDLGPSRPGIGADGRVIVPSPARARPHGPAHLTQSHSVSGPEGNQNILTVDYVSRWWFTYHETDRLPPSAMPDITDPDSVRKAIAGGTVDLLGHETVDGLDTLHLRLFGPNRSYRIDMWVDATTYLPVQDIAAKSSGNRGAQEFPAAYATTTKYSWLPRTQENLAHLVLTPPPGFEKR